MFTMSPAAITSDSRNCTTLSPPVCEALRWNTITPSPLKKFSRLSSPK